MTLLLLLHQAKIRSDAALLRILGTGTIVCRDSLLERVTRRNDRKQGNRSHLVSPDGISSHRGMRWRMLGTLYADSCTAAYRIPQRCWLPQIWNTVEFTAPVRTVQSTAKSVGFAFTFFVECHFMDVYRQFLGFFASCGVGKFKRNSKAIFVSKDEKSPKSVGFQPLEFGRRIRARRPRQSSTRRHREKRSSSAADVGSKAAGGPR